MSELEQLCEKKGLTAEFLYGEAVGDGWKNAVHNWRCTLTYQGRSYSCDFFGGESVTTPSAADVVSSLVLDCTSVEDPDQFDELCGDTKFSEVLKLWHALEEAAPKIRAFLGDNFDKFAEAEH